ncbi:M43 family zinc metalloprotease [Spirosoma fluminis]
MNIVVTPTLINAAGYAYYPSPYVGQSPNEVYVSAYWLGRQMNLLPHEVGHYFNLMHTFDFGGTGKKLVNGSNCSTAGDLVRDTPADPYDVTNPGTLNNGCEYNGTLRDANGELYRPDMNVLAPVLLVCSREMYEATLSLEQIEAVVYLVHVRIGDQTLVQRLLIR